MIIAAQRNRLLGLSTLLFTGIIWLVVEANLSTELSLLDQYNISPEAIHIYFVTTLAFITTATLATNRIRSWINRSPLPQFIIVLATIIIIVFAMTLLGGSQPTRLFSFPVSLWLTTVHIVSLSALVVAFTTGAAEAKTENTLKYMSLGVLAVSGITLIILHVVSLGEFMALDLPDEPWLASAATNFALHGNFSPSYIASVFGTPDPAISRYFFAMGLWAKLLSNTSISALRAFPLLAGGIAAVLTAFVLAKQGLSRTQVLIGLLVLISLSAFVRTSHNLRMDIGLSVYGILILWGIVSFFNSHEKQKRWPALMGFSLYVGLETVPFAGLPLGVTVGVALLVWLFKRPNWQKNWQYVAIYMITAAIACLAYLVAHFLPDLQASITGFSQFTRIKSDVSAAGEFRNPLLPLFNYHIHFSLLLSPIEFVIVAFSLIRLWQSQLPADRWIAAIIIGSAGLMLMLTPATYGYWTMYTPFIAYAIARMTTMRFTSRLATFVLIPALIAAPAYDLYQATVEKPNQKRLAEAETITSMFEPGSTILGEPLFWFTLHADHNYIGWTGFGRYRMVYDTSYAETMAILDPDSVICWTGYDSCVRVTTLDQFSEPIEVEVDDNIYYVFHRLEEL